MQKLVSAPREIVPALPVFPGALMDRVGFDSSRATRISVHGRRYLLRPFPYTFMCRRPPMVLQLERVISKLTKTDVLLKAMTEPATVKT